MPASPRAAVEWPFAPGASPFHIKGLGYRSLIQYVETSVAGGMPRLLDAIEDPALRAFARQPFLAASWYDVGPVITLNETIAGLLEMKLDDFLAMRGRMQAEDDLSGVYSWLLAVATPSAVAKGLPRLTQRYFDWGGVEIETPAQRHVRAIRTGVPVYLADWFGSVSCAFLEVAMGKAGAKRFTCDVTRAPWGEPTKVPSCALPFDMHGES